MNYIAPGIRDTPDLSPTGGRVTQRRSSLTPYTDHLRSGGSVIDVATGLPIENRLDQSQLRARRRVAPSGRGAGRSAYRNQPGYLNDYAPVGLEAWEYRTQVRETWTDPDATPPLARETDAHVVDDDGYPVRGGGYARAKRGPGTSRTP